MPSVKSSFHHCCFQLICYFLKYFFQVKNNKNKGNFFVFFWLISVCYSCLWQMYVWGFSCIVFLLLLFPSLPTCTSFCSPFSHFLLPELIIETHPVAIILGRFRLIGWWQWFSFHSAISSSSSAAVLSVFICLSLYSLYDEWSKRRTFGQRENTFTWCVYSSDLNRWVRKCFLSMIST